MNILILSQRFWPENFRINIIAEKLKKKKTRFILLLKNLTIRIKLFQKNIREIFFIMKIKMKKIF